MKIKQQGFTLIEILVALAILAVIGMIAAVCLHRMIVFRQRAVFSANQWRQLAVAHQIIQQDFANAVYVDPNSPAGKRMQGFSGSSNNVSFERWGIAQSSFMQSSPLMHVSYSLAGNSLLREQQKGVVVSAKPILQHVTQLQFYYLNASNRWLDSWSPRGQLMGQMFRSVTSLPLVLQVTFHVRGVGQLTWLFIKPLVSG